MDRGAWQATVHAVAESDTTKQLTHILQFFITYHRAANKYIQHGTVHMSRFQPGKNYACRRAGTEKGAGWQVVGWMPMIVWEGTTVGIFYFSL